MGISAIILFFSGVLVWAFTYGPAKRTFVNPGKTITVKTVGEIEKLWQSSGVHGRTAVIFARYPKQDLSGSDFPAREYLETAMRHGIVRRAYFIVPDKFWSDLVSEMLGRKFKTTDNGFIVADDGGRILFMPLSKYVPEGDEKALVALEPAAWSPQEHLRINTLLSSGLMASDLLVTIGDRN
jgi:hypothetical protein